MYNASVVIPTYNRSELLEMTLNSLTRQQLNPEFRFEVIVVDDGSDDDTRDIVKQFKTRFSNLRYYYQKNKGYRVARARNIGTKKSKGELIIFVDSGVIVSENFVYEHCKAHGFCENFVVIGTVYGFQATLDDKIFFNVFDNNNLSETFLRLKNNARFHDPRYGWYKSCNFDIKNAFAPWIFFWTCNVSVKKRLLISAGMFDENYNSWGVEDLDLGYRLFKSKASFVVGKNADAIHYPHCTVAETDNKNNSNNKNLIYFHKKYHCLETEMCLGWKGPTLDREVGKLWNDSPYEMFDFNCLLGTKILNGFNDKKVLVVGGGNGSIIGLMNNADILEINKENVKKIMTFYPKSKVYNLLGAYTHFDEKEYDIVFITDFFQYLSRDWLIKVLIESMRIGENIYILHGVTIKDQIMLSVSQEKIDECTRLIPTNKDNHNDIVIKDGDVILNLIQICKHL